MTSKNDYREFNLEHAKAGAPVIQKDGVMVEIIKFNAKNDRPLVIIKSLVDEDIVSQRRLDGKSYSEVSQESDLVMAPLGYIDGKPVFTGDRIISPGGGEYKAPSDLYDFHGFEWPKPRVKYPKSALTAESMLYIHLKTKSDASPDNALKLAADIGIQLAIERGDVLLPPAKEKAPEMPINATAAYVPANVMSMLAKFLNGGGYSDNELKMLISFGLVFFNIDCRHVLTDIGVQCSFKMHKSTNSHK